MTRRRRKADTAPATAQPPQPEANCAVASGSPLPPRPDSKLGIVLSLLQAAEGGQPRQALRGDRLAASHDRGRADRPAQARLCDRD